MWWNWRGFKLLGNLLWSFRLQTMFFNPFELGIVRSRTRYVNFTWSFVVIWVRLRLHRLRNNGSRFESTLLWCKGGRLFDHGDASLLYIVWLHPFHILHSVLDFLKTNPRNFVISRTFKSKVKKIKFYLEFSLLFLYHTGCPSMCPTISVLIRQRGQLTSQMVIF